MFVIPSIGAMGREGSKGLLRKRKGIFLYRPTFIRYFATFLNDLILLFTKGQQVKIL